MSQSKIATSFGNLNKLFVALWNTSQSQSELLVDV